MDALGRIRKAAAARGWDIARLAVECRIKRAQIYQIARGKRGTSKHLPTIAAALGVPVSWIFAAESVENLRAMNTVALDRANTPTALADVETEALLDELRRRLLAAEMAAVQATREDVDPVAESPESDTLSGLIDDIEREIPRAAARETPYDQHRAPRARRGARVAP